VGAFVTVAVRREDGDGPVPEDFHRPVRFPGGRFDSFAEGQDPAEISRMAHESAHALLSRVRAAPDTNVVERLVAFTDEHGVDALAELWSRSSPRSLPGALWRVYVLRHLIRQNPAEASYLFQRGVEATSSIDAVLAGASDPAGADEVQDLADHILRGLFEGDFAIALDRAAAFCRLSAAGCTSIADDLEPTEPHRSTDLTSRALRLSRTGSELVACAQLWRRGSLD
jgi:hypothetical protein